MGQSTVLTGAKTKVVIGGNTYAASSISYSIDYGEKPIYGIDSIFPQEIATTRISVQGNISGFKIHFDGGLQGLDLRSKINQVLYAPYLSLRLVDRKTNYDILYVDKIKISNESLNSVSKGVVTVSFTFKGIVPYGVLDRE